MRVCFLHDFNLQACGEKGEKISVRGWNGGHDYGCVSYVRTGTDKQNTWLHGKGEKRVWSENVCPKKKLSLTLCSLAEVHLRKGEDGFALWPQP